MRFPTTCMCDKQRLRPRSLIKAFACAYSTSVKLLTEHHLEFLSLKCGATGSSESTLVEMPHFWKSHVMAHICMDMVKS